MNKLYFIRDAELSRRWRGAFWCFGRLAVVVVLFSLVNGAVLSRGNDDNNQHNQDYLGGCYE